MASDRDQTAVLSRALESGALLSEVVLMHHLALALSRQADQARGIKDILRDVRGILEEVFPVAEGAE